LALKPKNPMSIINVIISAFNEAYSIEYVIGDIPNIVDDIIVVNNNSRDANE
jgi:hypothetical protein